MNRKQRRATAGRKVSESRNFIETQAIPSLPKRILTKKEAETLQSLYLDIYTNRQKYTQKSDRSVLPLDQSNKFRGVVSDVRYGIRRNGKLYKNAVKAICIMFPELNFLDGWSQVDSHLWLFLDQMVPPWDEKTGEEKTINICFGDTLEFLGFVRSYRSNGALRRGIKEWSPIKSRLCYTFNEKKVFVPEEIPKKASIASYCPDTKKIGVTVKAYIEEDLKYLRDLTPADFFYEISR